MWVFGYGSLMWDNWEKAFECRRSGKATLLGYRRDFNKSSVANWGTEQSPCPTLGLATDEEGECVGIAFELPDGRSEDVYAYLSRREGRSFSLQDREVRLASGSLVTAAVPINDTESATYIGDRSIVDRAMLVSTAHGSEGACFDYVDRIHRQLLSLSIHDVAVQAFWAAVAEGATS